MKKLLMVMLSFVFTMSLNVVPVHADSINDELGGEIDFAEAIYDENGGRILDASELIPDEELLSQPHDVDLPLARADWNMVTKNLSTGTLSFFYFDQSTMTSTSTRASSSQSNVKT